MYASGEEYSAGRESPEKNSRWAYIGHRVPVEIQYILTVEHVRGEGDAATELTTEFALVRRLVPDDSGFEPPWSMW